MGKPRTYMDADFSAPPAKRMLVLIPREESPPFPAMFDPSSKAFIAVNDGKSYSLDDIYSWTDASEGDGHPGVDWSHAPDFAKFWAVQPDGRAVWFGVLAERPASGGPFVIYGVERGAPMFGWEGDYAQSLTTRPDD